MTKRLKPYNPAAVCGKCGGTEVATAYHAKNGNCYYGEECRGLEREHLHRTCQRCRFSWNEHILRIEKSGVDTVPVVDSPILFNLKSLRPNIVCLCGARPFRETFGAVNLRETLAGNIVIDKTWYAANQVQLDEFHKRKIDLADEVLVLNVGGYIDESTNNEIAYASAQGKLVRYLEENSHD